MMFIHCSTCIFITNCSALFLFEMPYQKSVKAKERLLSPEIHENAFTETQYCETSVFISFAFSRLNVSFTSFSQYLIKNAPFYKVLSV